MSRRIHVDRSNDGIIAAYADLGEIRSRGAIDIPGRIRPSENQAVSGLMNSKILYSARDSDERRERIANFATTRNKQEEPDNCATHLEDVSAKILVLDDFGQHLLHVSRVDPDGFLLQVRPLE